jgi:cyanophycin synthetase
MKILEIKVLRGPNYWSNYRKQLIDMRLDLEDYENFPTNKIEGFAERLEKMLPSLRSHQCSKQRDEGFFERVREGTWLGHVIEHIALEIQSLAGMACGYGRTRSASVDGVYHVVFSYTVERAGIYAAKAAVDIATALAENKPYDIGSDIKALVEINKNDGYGPSTKAILNEAKKRDIPFRAIDNNSFFQLGYGKYQKIIRATLSSDTSIIGIEIADDKELTKKILAGQNIPVPTGKKIANSNELQAAIDMIGFPVCIKPANGNHGRGVTTNINSYKAAVTAFEFAKKISTHAIVEKFLKGSDYRFLVINYRLVAVARRIPAMITGDGKSTIEQLIQQVNEDPRRGDEHEKILTRIEIDGATLALLALQNLGIHSVLQQGEVVFLKNTANLSTGGTARDVTHLVHPENIFLAERIARLVNLNICGVDIIASDIREPITVATGGVLEVNAAPGLRMHLSPTKGLPQNVAEPIIEMLFPSGSSSRIPIVAVTGTNGKTTTTRLIAHLAKLAGHTVGYTTTDGIYLGNQKVVTGDCTGPTSAATVLRDSCVDFAVLECARGGILRAGLGFDKCETSIITNIAGDHLGLEDIDSIEKLARVKSVVAHSTTDSGYAILNADDDIVFGLGRELSCNIALFSVKERNERVRQHCSKGGIAAIIEKGYFTICKGGWRTRIARVSEVPLTLEGKATCMISNVLPAILAATIHNIEINTIKKGLQTFLPSKENTPGRMNIFRFPNFSVMVDYAHNKDGLCQLKNYLDQTTASVRVGIVACPGDRRDEDIRAIGICAAGMFDEIIIKHDKDGRGRTNEEITELIRAGIDSVNASVPVIIVSDELEAVQYAINTAKDDYFIVVCTEKVEDVLDFVSRSLSQIQVTA